MSLIFQGCCISKDKTLKEYAIYYESFLNVVLYLRGG